MALDHPAMAENIALATVAPAVRTLSELFEIREFGCVLATGGSDQRLRVDLAGAHSIDLAQPGAWLEADWVMLSTCGNIDPEDLEAQRKLIVELDRCGVAGLGFGVGVFHDVLLPGLLAEAAARDFPIFEIPLGTPFRDIIASVHRGVSNEDAWRANRMITMQAFLTDSLVERDPTEAILGRLSSLVGMDAGIADAKGNLQPQGTLPRKVDAATDEIGNSLSHGSSGVVTCLEIGEYCGFAVPIPAVVGGGRCWLVLLQGGGQSINTLAKPAAQLAVSVLSAVARLDRGQRLREAAGRRAVFDSLLGGVSDHEERLANCHAESAGIRVEDGVCAIALIGRGGHPLPPHLFAELDNAFAAASIPFVGSAVGGGIRGVVAADGSIDALRRLALPLAEDLIVGVGRTVRSVVELQRSVTDAEVAARTHVDRTLEPIVRYDEIDLVTACLSELPLDRLGPKIEQSIRGLRESESVYETLMCYFEHNLDVSRTAKVLHMHPNSIRYRLARVEQAIGSSLRAPSTIVALHLAMLLDRTDEPGGIGETHPVAGSI